MKKKHTSTGGRRGLLLGSLSLAALALSACAPIPQLPPAAQPLKQEQLGLPESAQASTLQAKWWEGWHDAQLNALMDKALQEAPSLAMAQARVARAAAVFEDTRASQKVQTGVGLDIDSQRFSENSIYPPPFGGNVYGSGTLQIGASYDWDFFGRHEAALNAALGQQRVAQAETEAARLNISSAIARTWLSLAQRLAQQDLVAEQLAARADALALVHQRRAAGLDTELDLRGAEAPMRDLERQREVLRLQAHSLRLQLAALSAQPAQSLQNLRPALPQPLSWSQSPSVNLLAQRPDLRAALARVQAAGYEMDVAKGRFYPDLSLHAAAGFTSIGLDKMLQGGSRFFDVGPSLRLPIFDSGRLRAQYRASAAEQDAAIAAYNGAVLEAVRDASEQDEALRSVGTQLQTQGALLKNAQSQTRLAEQRNEAGVAGRLPVLVARQNQLSQERQLLDLQAQQLDAQVQLIRALGGAPEPVSQAASN